MNTPEDYSSKSLLVTTEQQEQLTSDGDILKAWNEGQFFIAVKDGRTEGEVNLHNVKCDHVSITFGEHFDKVVYIALTARAYLSLREVAESKTKDFARKGNVYFPPRT